MKALTFQGIGKIDYRDVPDPLIKDPRDVIVQVEYSAVCGSDLHVYHGRETGIDRGTVMGHEFTGRIVEKGKRVTTLKPGDRVISPFTTSCGKCFFCRIGLTARCSNGQLFGWIEEGKGLHGGQAEYVRVPLADTTLVKYPDTIPPAHAMLAGDILATGYYCAEKAGAGAGGTFAVLGCGPVGLMAIMSALEMGANRVFGIDSVPFRLETAGSLGAEPVDFVTENPVNVILEKTKGIGVDAVMEAAGTHEATRLAYRLARPGGIISTVGVHTDTCFAITPVEAYDKNITFFIGRCPARFYMDTLLRKMEEKKLDPGRIITHWFDLREGERAYRVFDAREDNCIKAILKC